MQAPNQQPSPLTVPDKRPLTLTEAYLRQCGVELKHWRDDFFKWETSSYRRQVMEEFRAGVRLFLNRLRVNADNGSTYPLNATNAVVAEVIGQLRDLCQVRAETMPAWINHAAGRPDPRNVIAFENGWIDATKYQPGDLIDPPTSDWFSELVIPCSLNHRARCDRWIDFVTETIADPELILLLQEWFGYVLTPDTSLQKMLWLYGPPGAGKSTITRIMREVVGRRNSVSFTLWQMTQRFTLASFVGRTLAVSGDAHLSRDTDGKHVIENIKGIVGEDDQLIDRKNRDMLTDARLTVRLVICTNSLPRLPDSADTLRRRTLPIPLERSFSGQEDPHLFEKLAEELPGIVNWSIAGLLRLRANGQFTKPPASGEILNRLSDLTTPIRTFIDDCCEIDANAETLKDDLYKAYREWCTREGLDRPLAKAGFCEALYDNIKTLKSRRPRDAYGGRIHVLCGITLRPGIGQEAPFE